MQARSTGRTSAPELLLRSQLAKAREDSVVDSGGVEAKEAAVAAGAETGVVEGRGTGRVAQVGSRILVTVDPCSRTDLNRGTSMRSSSTSSCPAPQRRPCCMYCPTLRE